MMDCMNHLYGRKMKKINNSKNSNVYEFKNRAGGVYVVTSYELFPGVDVFFNDIHVNKISSNIEWKKESFEINHCREGRFECTLKDGTITYMEAGDFAINPVKNKPSESTFPISHYHGVTIYITPSELSDEVILLEKIFGISYADILNKLCGNDRLFIKRATPKIQHIFHEIYHVPEDIVISYLKVKIQELFLYLSTINPKIEFKDREYFTKSNTDIVKRIHDFINQNIENHYTHEELSSMFLIKQTTMKKCYKSIYGETIHTTLMKTRLKKAANLLKSTSNNVTDIALSVGYSSSGKFSTAFKKMYNVSPSQYRKLSVGLGNFCRIGKE